MLEDTKILVVDDNPNNLEIALETLSSEGYTVATVTSGERALNRLGNYLPDLILLDVMMPGIGGFETCQKIKANPETSKIPVIFMTALSDVENKVNGLSLGAVDYITKPFQERELLARVKTHLQLYHYSQQMEQLVAEQTADLHEALSELKQSQLQLVQHEKMSVLGNLVAGVGHEINNPAGFLHCNISPAQAYVKDLLSLIELYQAEYPHPNEKIDEEIETIDLSFIQEDLPELLRSMKVGVGRIQQISKSLRIFSRQDQDHKTLFNLHEGIDSTLLILKHRTKGNDQRPNIEIIKNFGNIPEIACFPGQLNQVFMNIFANAIDAMDMANQGKTYHDVKANPNTITIQTSVIEGKVQILIQDNGCGMAPETTKRIFEQGFTTKDVGKGTGLGMAIAHQIIVETHGGSLKVHSEMGQGTEFCMYLPI
ncbi:MAG: response regulator [Cyanobacteria bacterium P01_F01_bin.53]